MAIRAFSLQPHEQQLFDIYTAQRGGLLARFAELTLELEEIRKRIEAAGERHRTLLGEAVARNGMEQYFQSARIEGKNLICEVPDNLPDAPGPQMFINGRANDGLAIKEQHQSE